MDENYEPLGDVGGAAVPPPPEVPPPPPPPPSDAPPPVNSPTPPGPAVSPIPSPVEGKAARPQAPPASPALHPPGNTFDMDADAYAQLPGGKQASAKNKSGIKKDAEGQNGKSNSGGGILEMLRSRSEAQLQCMIVSFTIFCSLTVVFIAMLVLLITQTKLYL